METLMLIFKIIAIAIGILFIIFSLLTIIIILSLKDPTDEKLVDTDYINTTSSDENLFI